MTPSLSSSSNVYSTEPCQPSESASASYLRKSPSLVGKKPSPVPLYSVSCHTALSENGLCEAVCTIQPEGYASAGSGAVELRYDAVFQVQTFSRQTLQNLSGGTLDLTKQQNTQRPSVVIRRMSENAALWDLARQYRTTAQSIQQANHLTQPEADAGRLLLIPM